DSLSADHGVSTTNFRFSPANSAGASQVAAAVTHSPAVAVTSPTFSKPFPSSPPTFGLPFNSSWNVAFSGTSPELTSSYLKRAENSYLASATRCAPMLCEGPEPLFTRSLTYRAQSSVSTSTASIVAVYSVPQPSVMQLSKEPLTTIFSPISTASGSGSCGSGQVAGISAGIRPPGKVSRKKNPCQVVVPSSFATSTKLPWS